MNNQELTVARPRGSNQGTMPQTAALGGRKQSAVLAVGLSFTQGQKVFGTFSPVGNLGGFGE